MLNGASLSLLVWNPGAGRSRGRDASAVRAALAEHGAVELLETTPDGTGRLLRSHLGSGIERVYVLGGDGTVGDVAGALLDSETPLGILPCGTSNVVARECHIPLRPLRAAHALARSGTTRVFRAWSTGRGTLLLGLGVGFDARLMWNTSANAKRRFGILAVGATAFRELFRYDFPPLEVEGEDAAGQPFKAKATSVLVGNGQRYAGDPIMMPGADPEDDALDVLLLASPRRMDLAAFWGLSALPGSPHLKVAGVTHLRARRLVIDCPTAVEVHLNGDPHGRTPVRLEPCGAVRLLVPA